MKKLNRKGIVLSILLWTWGASLYFLLEVFYKTITNHPERISWTMLVLAFILCIPVERCGSELPWEMPLWLQSLICAALVTVVEFMAGMLLNVYLNLGIWDYSSMPFNILGQICPQFSAIWFLLCFIFIPFFDRMRWIVEGGDKPLYRWWFT